MSEQAAEAFAGVEQTLAAVEEHLAVFQKQSIDEFVAPLAPLERAKVQVSLGASRRPGPMCHAVTRRSIAVASC
jgi:hypothetical protein